MFSKIAFDLCSVICIGFELYIFSEITLDPYSVVLRTWYFVGSYGSLFVSASGRTMIIILKPSLSLSLFFLAGLEFELGILLDPTIHAHLSPECKQV